jgi:ABC-type uncharacterized transport system substrate-binding protein
MRLLGAAILLVLSVGAVTPVRAHPHVFVDVAVAVSFGERGLEAVHLTWTFDERYSASLFFGLDRDDSGGFTPAAILGLERHVRGLEPLGFLVDVQVNGAAVAVTGLRDFRAAIEGDRVVNTFTLPVSPPDSSEGVVTINVADPGFYIAFSLLEPVPVEAVGIYQVDCRVARDVQTKRPEGVRCDYRRRAP